MIERRIKELSFALEALSRINGQSTFMYEVENLLREALREAKEQSNVEKPKPNTISDYDTPF